VAIYATNLAVFLTGACIHDFWQIWYDMVRELNVDWKADCGQLNLAHATKKQKKMYKKKKLEQTNTSAQYLVWSNSKVREGSSMVDLRYVQNVKTRAPKHYLLDRRETNVNPLSYTVEVLYF